MYHLQHSEYGLVLSVFFLRGGDIFVGGVGEERLKTVRQYLNGAFSNYCHFPVPVIYHNNAELVKGN